jgi:hypothetical protein
MECRRRTFVLRAGCDHYSCRDKNDKQANSTHTLHTASSPGAKHVDSQTVMLDVPRKGSRPSPQADQIRSRDRRAPIRGVPRWGWRNCRHHPSPYQRIFFPHKMPTATSVPLHRLKQGALLMLGMIAIVLFILWLMGLGTAYSASGLIHILLVLAIALVLIRVIQGRRAV